MDRGFVVLETGEVFEGRWHGGMARAGEVIFNTSHAGYEEIATDPSYYSQIMVMTAPMQGNYGADRAAWESRQIWIDGFACLEIQSTSRDGSWMKRLIDHGVPVISELDTRRLVLRLRDQGTPWGAVVQAGSVEEARALSKALITRKKETEKDWVHAVSRREVEVRMGVKAKGPRIAVLDYGCKENTVRELMKVSSEVGLFPSRTLASMIRDWAPTAIMLTNGPGDPADVRQAVETVKDLLGWKPIFGICMGNQILARALGANTFKLKFGHRGGNHPVRDLLLNEVYMTSQNHGYAVNPDTLPSNVRVSHVNLNDKTVEGIECREKKCFSVQFHPESHPGPRDARRLFDYFVNGLSL